MTLLNVGCQYFTTPCCSDEISQSSPCDHAAARTALSCAYTSNVSQIARSPHRASCTCEIVSKLKPMPFHSVNSPILEPVNSLRPSGVHFTTLIGCLTLFREECRSFAGTESTPFWGFAEGGRICPMGEVRTYLDWLKLGFSWSYIRRLCNLGLASPSPCGPLPCILVADVASIVPLTRCSL